MINLSLFVCLEKTRAKAAGEVDFGLHLFRSIPNLNTSYEELIFGKQNWIHFGGLIP